MNGGGVPEPMLATLGPAPAGEGYTAEFKHDGQRGRILIGHNQVVVLSRNSAVITATFPEITAAAAEAILPARRRVILDGEIVALDRAGRPSFERLQRRWPQNRRPSAQLLREVPVRFFAFDVLAVDDADVCGLPHWRRREILDALLPVAGVRTLVVPPAFTEVVPAAVLEVAREHAYEGIVSKRTDSAYRPGRSRAWIKTPVRRSVEAKIVAFYGGPRRGVAAVILAAHDADGQLRIIGQVGSGLAGTERVALYDVLSAQRATAPIVPAELPGRVQWVVPTLVAEVAYRQYTARGGLRHAAWKGLRAVVEEGALYPLPAEDPDGPD